MKIVFGIAACLLFASGIPLTASDTVPLGSPDFYPSPEHPVGWRGDGSGRFPGATPPIVWSRRLADITSEIVVQADKPKGKPATDIQTLAYFTLKDWLVAGPFPAADPEKDIDNDFLGGEAEIQPDAGDKAGTTQWKVHRASEGSQSFHDFNQARFLKCGWTLSTRSERLCRRSHRFRKAFLITPILTSKPPMPTPIYIRRANLTCN